VHFYDRDDVLAATLEAFLIPGLARGEAAMVVATRPHRRAFDALLARHGFDRQTLERRGLLTVVDAHETLASLQAGGRLTYAAFSANVAPAVRRLTDLRRPLRLFGEMVVLLQEAGETATTLELERWWTAMMLTQPLTVRCSFPQRTFAADAALGPLLQICGEHDHFMPLESVATGGQGGAFDILPPAVRDVVHNAGHDFGQPVVAAEGTPLDSHLTLANGASVCHIEDD
jgi:hypothetical protein